MSLPGNGVTPYRFRFSRRAREQGGARDQARLWADVDADPRARMRCGSFFASDGAAVPYWSGTARMAEDAGDAAEFLLARLGTDQPLFVIGESMGGAVAIHAAAAGCMPHLRGIVLAAPGALASRFRHRLLGWIAAATRFLAGDSELVFERLSGWELTPSAAIRLLGDPLVMRGVMIGVGAELIEHFSWALYVLGAFLVYAGIRLFFKKEEAHPEKGRIVGFANRHLRVMREYQDDKFFVRKGGRIFATPLLVVLMVIELTDVTLAVDSIPAVFGITRDPFIVYTSNVLAILGLRALYFLLAGIIDRVRFLDEGLAVVLVFIGGKMIGEPRVRIPVDTSLLVVGGVLLVALLASVLIPAKKKV